MTALEFQVWDPSNGDISGAYTVEAFDGAEAAGLWAELSDGEGDYGIVGGNETTVVVLDLARGDTSFHVVSGETTAAYYSREAKIGPRLPKG